MAAIELVTLESTYDPEMLDLIAESEEYIQASKRSVLNSRRHTEQIKALGGATLNKLHHQGHQLDAIDGKVDGIREEVKEGERQLTSIESVFGAVRNKFISRPSKKDGKKGVSAKGKRDEKGVSAKGKRDEKGVSAKGKKSKVKVGSSVPSPDPELFKHLPQTAQDDLQEIDAHLDAIHQNLDEIHKMAKIMGDELTQHNQKLETLNPKVGATTQRVAKASARTRRQF